MSDWIWTPAKIFIVGMLLAIISAFTWQSIEIRATHEAAVNAAHSAVANTNDYQSAAQQAANQTLPSAMVDSVSQVGDNLTQATVSYHPQNVFGNVFSYLGVPNCYC